MLKSFSNFDKIATRDNMKKIVIIGGGISGLTAAYMLVNQTGDLEVTVLESDKRPGGKIWTEKADGFLCEKGPNGFLDNKPGTLELCKSLGIDPVRSNENSKKRFIFSEGKLKALPESPVSFLKSDLMTLSGKLRLLLELNAPKGPADETVADFIIRRLGNEALEKLIDPMCSGIYAGDPDRMSIKSCFPRIKELEQEYGSLFKALFKIRKQKKMEQKNAGNPKVSVAPGGTLTSFYDGIQTITDAMAEKLGKRIRLGVSAANIIKENGSYRVNTSEGDIYTDIVILATPAFASSDILRDLDRELADKLSGIPYPHVSVVCFGYKRDKVTHPLNGFGFLVPHREKRNILGTLWDSSVFPNRASEENVLLRSMIGGAKNPVIETFDDNKVADVVLSELKGIMGLNTDPDFTRVYRWDRAIPQYAVGHIRILDFIEKKLENYPGLYLTGNAYKGIGINDCVENSQKLAEDILKQIQNA
jgi:oxygen-dependent protoporphyrinogen oxidase